jgi:hypothetical protein
MMDTQITPTRTFIQVAEVWVPRDGRLVLHAGDYGAAEGFAEASEAESFGVGEGLPGRAWELARPVVMTNLETSAFKRSEAALAAGLTSGVAMPIFASDGLKAVLVILCSEDAVRMGALEVWAEKDGVLTLADGYFGAAKDFEAVTRQTSFARGQGLPGGVWAARTPILMRDLGAGQGFMRAESAGKAGLSTGLGLPVPVPGGRCYVLALLSAAGSPIARRFEIWDARAARSGKSGEAVLIDGICAREGKLWDEDNPRRIARSMGPIGQVLASGLPVIESAALGLAAGYSSMVALPIYRGSELAFIVAWYL